MTGIFNLRPTKPKYIETWDVSKVLSYLKSLPPDETISLKLLTCKLAMLTALTQASRAQSLNLLTLEGMIQDDVSCTLYYSGLLKQSRRGRINPVVTFKIYTPDRRICVFRTLNVYIKRTEHLRGDEKRLFISYIKPYSVVTTTSISRWIKTVMHLSDTDTTRFKSHSTRSASTSKAKQIGVPLSKILSVAGWASDKTFSQYYEKPLENTANSFDHAVLQ